ncbi:Kelch repeat-containing protein [Rheinheimera sp. 4Y26]|uniref:Kelch repeat-containing protein n=1 Tax=Rheinheimera sp. 4Y26 TaxID=2977811 RepID=UPI0021B0B2F7|nr:galactose oxidase [Rheinheimera sp. 4Y26]MCT6699575.1 galactose oxidase [Rheinheimera sp. 4Y26]
MATTIMLVKSKPTAVKKSAITGFFCLLAMTVAASFPLAAAEIPTLPEPVSNQLVLQASVRGQPYLASFAGLGSAKTPAAMHNKVWQLSLGQSNWQNIAALPGTNRVNGRIAATGVELNKHFFILGGYGQSSDGKSGTLADGYRFSPVTQSYSKLPDMPVAVDESVAFAHKDRYIYLLAGFHHSGAVNLVQLFDNFTQKWSQATPLTGTAVFGHAGVLVGNDILFCDGVKTTSAADGSTQFVPEAACYLGKISDKNASQISWRQIAHHGGKARTRQGAIAVEVNGETMAAFIGGSETPYHLNGLTDDGKAIEPSSAIYLYSFKQQRWLKAAPSETAVMDLRSLVLIDGEIFSIGGMLAGQQLSNTAIKHQIKLLPE